MVRGLVFSFGSGPINLMAISIAAFITTLVQDGPSGELAAQAARAVGLMFSLGMLLLWLLASLVASGGWLLIRLSGRGVGGVALFAAGVLIAALPPAIFGLFVLGLPLGVCVALATTGLFAAAMRGAVPATLGPQATAQAIMAPRPAQAGFGRRI